MQTNAEVVSLTPQDSSAVAPSGLFIFGRRYSTQVVVAAVIVAILFLGVMLGFAAIGNISNPYPWDVVSATVGWWYFLAWSISFLPQIYLNHIRRSVLGQSLEFVYLNVLGYICYSAYTICFYFVNSIKEDYRERFGDENIVAPNDVGFALWALIWCLINLGQIYTYATLEQKCSKVVKFAISILTLLMTVWGLLIVCGVWSPVVFNALDFLYGASIIKLGVTLVKYIPQVILNFRRKLTVGWNIWNVLLDFSGGILSVIQMIIDCSSTGHWNGIVGNPVKFFLGLFSMVYDVIFMIQHFYLYKDNNQRLHRLASSSSPSKYVDPQMVVDY